MEGSTEPRTYEFNTSENVVIGGAARWVGIWAWFAIIGGILVAVAGVFTLPVGLANLVFGIVYLLIGMYFRQSAQSLSSVVTTAGSDIRHLMLGLDKLRAAFKFMVIIAVIGMVVVILAVIIGAAAMAAGAGAGAGL